MMLRTYISKPIDRCLLQEEADDILKTLNDMFTHLIIQDIRIVCPTNYTAIIQINYTGYYVEET